MGKSNGQGGWCGPQPKARTRPRRTCSIFLLRWGTGGPLTDRRAAPGPTRAGGVWLVQIPPASRSPRLARGSRYSERGRGGSVPQLPQAAPGCPQALARSLTSRAGLLRSRAFTPKVAPGARLDNRVRPASAVPPVRDEMGGAGRPGPVCGGMARDETFNRAAQPGASPRPARVEAGLAGRNRGRGPKGTPCLCPCKRLCCTNRVRDSFRESSVVAVQYEQTHTPRLQDQELARL